MSLQPENLSPVPQQTAQVAKAAFPRGNFCLKLRDELGAIYQDEQFRALFSREGQPALAPWRLALVSILQFVEGLSDRQAANMVRSRIDWKYLLGLELTDSGFDYSVLAEFRARLLKEEVQAETLLLDQLLVQLKEKKLLKARGQQRSDSTQVLASVRLLNRLEMLGETLRAALNALAVAAPEWLVEQIPSEWFDLYAKRVEDYRLPDKDSEREAWALAAGVDGFSLLQTLGQNAELDWLRQLPALQTLRQIWLQQFWWEEGQVKLRSQDNSPPPGQRIHSPYDVEARYATKQEIHWLGYKVHLTETCEKDYPNLITQVYTTPATSPDVKATGPIQQSLAERQLLPQHHIVDGGYISAEQILESERKYQLELVGPLRVDASWQGQRGEGYELSAFKLDWDKQVAVCPQGVVSQRWQEQVKLKGQTYLRVWFAKAECDKCEVRAKCTRSTHTGRILQLRPQAEHKLLEQVRQSQGEPEPALKNMLDQRAGIEGTLSQAVRVFGLRRARYRGLAKTHLQHLLTAVALNLVRVFAWWEQVPRAKTRVSRLAALKPAA